MTDYISVEQVTKYHPDKACDQISDAVLTAYLRQDPDAHCGIEALWKGSTVVLAGEITSNAALTLADREGIVRRIGNKLGYSVNKVVDLISEQSPEIKQAVDAEKKIGAGDQGIMYGYACRETKSKLPMGLDTANQITAMLERHVKEGDFILSGDAKTQVTIANTRGDKKVSNVLVSACSKQGYDIHEVRAHLAELLYYELGLDIRTPLLLNPAGLWTIGGPQADCGLTGRKIVCDQYGGYCAVGGGAFSGKDPSKVDRSGSYMARYLAIKALDEFPEIDQCEIQLAYAIGVPQPMSVNVKTGHVGIDSKYAREITRIYDLSPRGIIEQLHLLDKDYEQIAEGCHYRLDGILKGEI